MVPVLYSPSEAQAATVAAFRPRLVAARGGSLYEKAGLAREFMEALYDNGFVVFGAFLEWKPFWHLLRDTPALVASADLETIRAVLSYQALMDPHIDGAFVEFAYAPLADALLGRIEALYGLGDEAPEAEATEADAPKAKREQARALALRRLSSTMIVRARGGRPRER